MIQSILMSFHKRKISSKLNMRQWDQIFQEWCTYQVLTRIAVWVVAILYGKSKFKFSVVSL